MGQMKVKDVDVWIGSYRENYSQEKSGWVNNEEMTYTNWDTGFPAYSVGLHISH